MKKTLQGFTSVFILLLFTYLIKYKLQLILILIMMRYFFLRQLTTAYQISSIRLWCQKKFDHLPVGIHFPSIWIFRWTDLLPLGKTLALTLWIKPTYWASFVFGIQRHCRPTKRVESLWQSSYHQIFVGFGIKMHYAIYSIYLRFYLRFCHVYENYSSY